MRPPDRGTAGAAVTANVVLLLFVLAAGIGGTAALQGALRRRR
ncbi:hypothetical protein RAJCM14343_1837 [Rhodococcus aetherivorans]|uniref:Uncharacterized protein n=1 Tax=Rhodococcus aetherivorans TaxID=191292 RepID=A0ABQ0YJ94_9NOCA|nr:hypothetical protein RAJCM14343_1837 [Rhodococcus aetherivorans]CCW10003.1 hypothetical protein EBESD8_5310 [Rhodococcus aetherivorans]